jgi:hypothetical protein
LLYVPEHLYLFVFSKALGICSYRETSTEAITPLNIVAHSKVQPVILWPERKQAPWTPKEDATILKMREESGYSWEEIYAALPYWTKGTIQVHYSMELKK